MYVSGIPDDLSTHLKFLSKYVDVDKEMHPRVGLDDHPQIHAKKKCGNTDMDEEGTLLKVIHCREGLASHPKSVLPLSDVKTTH